MWARSPVKAWALAILIPFTAAACSTAAVVTRTDGTTARVTVVAGSQTDLFVEDENDRTRRVPRQEIRSIRHPGGIDIGLGVLFMLVGGVAVVDNASRCEADSQGEVICAVASVPAAIGLGLMIWGAVVNRNSSAAARDTSRASSLLGVPALEPAGWHARPLPRPALPPLDDD